MKRIKKIVVMLLTLAMVLGMNAAAFAATITINGGADGSKYAAFKLLDATDGGEGKFAYTLNETYAEDLKTVTNKETEQEIVTYISDLDSDATRAFANDIYAEIKDKAPDKTTSTNSLDGVEQGYYLIAETQTGNTGDTYSLVMLNTAGQENIEVTTKEDVPTLEKKVEEKNDSTGSVTGWQDGADYDIGDAVPFKLTGTVSDQYVYYKNYYYAFHDSLSDGLTFNADSVKVSIDGAAAPDGSYEVRESGADGCTFEVVFSNLKDIASVDAESVITVEYTASLNSGAVVGEVGNPNTAKLEYSSNPYDEHEGEPGEPDGPETGETPDDKVIVFTFQVVANKVDKDQVPLEGAGFTLYKFDSEANDYVAVGDEIKDVTTFTFTGLDSGKYKLVETTIPAGYNKADDILFTVEATYDTEADDPKLTGLIVKDEAGNTISGEGLTFTTDLADGSVNTDIVNLSGTELPETGGMGTTIFYIIGGLMMFGAAVLLITKRRMSVK